MDIIKSLMDAILNIFQSILGEDNAIFNSIKNFFESIGNKDAD